MKGWIGALVLSLVSTLAFAQTPPAGTGQRGQGQRGQGQRAERPTVVRPKDQRAPAPFGMDMVRPIAMADNVWMSELTILEMRDLVKKYGYTTALILNGTMESNGPYLTTGKHNHVLRVTGDAIARTLGNTLIAPIVMLDSGNPDNVTMPGSIKLRPETLQAVLKDMAASLKGQGFKEIFFIGDSGSNQNTLASVSNELAQAWKGSGVLVSHIREYYNYADVLKYQNEVLGKVELDKDLDGYHDDYYISSIIMNDSPQHVRYYQRVKVNLDHINSLPLKLDEALAIGKKLIQFRADATVAAINQRRAAFKSN
ncbi:MAG: creatininase family protein [Acidobacteria bacterium]|nr:creatininase family protein [Acidobacteriota bacterium]